MSMYIHIYEHATDIISMICLPCYTRVGDKSEATRKFAKFILNMKTYLSERDFAHKLWTPLYFYSRHFSSRIRVTFAGSRVLSVVSHSRNSSPNYYNQFTSGPALEMYISNLEQFPGKFQRGTLFRRITLSSVPFSLSALSVLSTYRSSLSLLRLWLSRACEIPRESWRNDFANIKETFPIPPHLVYPVLLSNNGGF